MKNKKSDRVQNKNILAWLLIAIGLIAGGIVGLSRSTTPGAASGWTIPDRPTYTMAIVDQNDDGIEDMFLWFDASWDFCEEDCREYMTAHAEILSGKDGSLIRSKYYIDDDPWVWAGSGHAWSRGLFTPVGTENEDIVFMGLFLKEGGNFKEVNLRKTSLIRISLANLKLEQTQNIFDMGWESDEPYINISKYRSIDPYFDLDYFNPQIDFLGNWSITSPGTSYDGGVLVIKSQFHFTNSTGDFIDDYKLSFINPNTFETLSTIIWDNKDPVHNNSLDYKIGFCEGPTFSYQDGWKMPYFYAISIIDSGISELLNVTVSLAEIGELKNDTATINWMVHNLTFSKQQSFFFGLHQIKLILSLNSTGDPVSLSLLHTETLNMDSPFTEEDKQINFNLVNKDDYREIFLEFNADFEVEYVGASRLSIYNIENQPVNTFTFESYLGEAELIQQNGLNISLDEEATDLGIINDIIPIKIDNTVGLAQTSIALICTSGTYSVQVVDEFRYPQIQYNILTLNASHVGLTIPSGTFNGTDFSGVSANMFHLPSFKDYSIDVRFDVDGDNKTDVPIPGLFLSNNIEKVIKDVENKPVNGPFAIFTDSDVIQELYWKLLGYQSARFLSDLNEDGLPDALIGESVAFLSITEIVQRSSFELIMEDPATRALFFLGIGCLVAGIVLIGFILVKLKNSKISLKSNNNKRQVLMLIVSILLVVVLYISIGTLLGEGGEGQQETLIGETPLSRSLKGLSNTSNFATFIFFIMLPVTAGVYMMLSPVAADGIVALNQIRFAKKAGLKAALKKEEMKDVEEIAHVNYKVLLIPRFGMKEKGSIIIGRILSILALGLAIGLNVFDFYFTYSSETLPTSITSISDPNFGVYCSALFTFLILPAIIAIPIFFWLIPTSWLLDDSGVVFYVKRLDSRKPEDVERIGGWFSNYLKGFLGISAIVSYVRFVIESPITASTEIAESGIAGFVYFFVFGFPIIAGLSIGLIALVMHEFALPHNVNFLYKRLSKRKVAVRTSEIKLVEKEEITPEDVIKGYLEKTGKITTKKSKRDTIPK